MPIIDGVEYCQYCGSTNVIPFPKAGVTAFKCLDCGSINRNPIVYDAIEKPVD